jgi:hypothetical protein
MIDTVILALPHKRISKADTDDKGMPMWDAYSSAKGFDKYMRNPRKEEKESGLYFPRITGINSAGKNGAMLSRVKIEFSVPKLLYGNNLDEVEDGQFDDVVVTLQNRLKTMGMQMSLTELKAAPIVAVHYAKNVLLGNVTVPYVISELEKLNVRKGIDFSKSQYRNNGQSIMANASEHAFIFYDKVADLSKGKSRAIDNEQFASQKALVKQIQGQNILRFEVRLLKRRKLNSVFIKLGYGINPSFAEVYSSAKAMGVLNEYWDKATTGSRTVLFARNTSAKDLLRQLYASHTAIKAKTAIYLVGLALLARERGGTRGLRAILGAQTNDRSWYRIARSLREMAQRITGLQPDQWFGEIEVALKSYQPFRL